MVAPGPRITTPQLDACLRGHETKEAAPVKGRHVLLAMLAALALAGPGSTQQAQSSSSDVLREIDHLRQETNELRRRAGRKPHRASFLERGIAVPEYREWVRAVWTSRLDHARRLTQRDTVWDQLARCETGGDWAYRHAIFQGGLGFYHGSWDAYRPRRFPSEAYDATREQQIAVGRRIRGDVGWGAWPACSRRLGLR